MSAETAILDQLFRGSFDSASHPWPLALRARLCDPRSRFISKGRVGKGHRAIARNGRVLLASDCALAELAGRAVHVRLQTWHKAILPDDPPTPYGILLCVRVLDPEQEEVEHEARLVSVPTALALDVGGGLWLEFRRAEA